MNTMATQQQQAAASAPTVAQLSDSYGSGSAAGPFGIGLPASAPVMTASHRGELVRQDGPQTAVRLQYGSEGSGSGSSVFSPQRHRSPKRPASAEADSRMEEGGADRSTRTRAAPEDATLQQRLDHIDPPDVSRKLLEPRGQL